MLTIILLVALASTRAYGQDTSPTMITEGSGGFTGSLPFGARFGTEIANIGDLDDDGVDDLAVGAPGESLWPFAGPGDSNFGVWILFMRPDATVKDQQLISASEGNFDAGRDLTLNDGFGAGLAGIGDLDNDGYPDIAVGAPHSRKNLLAFERSGAVYIIFLDKDGTAKSHRKITLEDLGESLHEEGMFGYEIASPGDIDGDDIPDLIVSEPFPLQSGPGSVWVLFLTEEGGVKSHVEISERKGGFDVDLTAGGNPKFGIGLVSLGHLDDDRVPDIAVIASGNGDRQLFILYLNSDGTVKNWSEIPGNAIPPESVPPSVGRPITTGASIGDYDDDGNPELVVNRKRALDGDGHGFAVLFLNDDASVKGSTLVDPHDDKYNLEVTRTDDFANSIAGIGDANLDGVLDLAVGAPGTKGSFSDAGAVFIFLDLPKVESAVDLVSVRDLTEEAPLVGTDVNVEAEIFGISDVVSVELNFRRGGDPSFFSAQMKVEDQNRYAFSIPAFAVSTRGIEYFITTTNAAGTESRAPSTGVISIPVRSEAGLTINLPSGTTTQDYRLVSFPLQLDNPSAAAVFEEGLGPFDPASWRLYAMGSSSSLMPYGVDDFDIVPGRAFFILSRDQNRVFSTPPGVSTATDNLYPIRIQRGWNLIGNPFNFAIPVSSLTYPEDVSGPIWTFDGAWRQETEAIQPLEGYAVWSDLIDTLWIDPDLSPSNVQQGASGTASRTAIETQRRQLEALLSSASDELPMSAPISSLDVYPNPFSDATTIKFELHEARRVRLTVHDVLGRRLADLTEGSKLNAGHYSIRWSSRGPTGVRLAAGTYFYRISAVGFDHTGVMMLVR